MTVTPRLLSSATDPLLIRRILAGLSVLNTTVRPEPEDGLVVLWALKNISNIKWFLGMDPVLKALIKKINK